ncbi:hypothetical protein L4C54_01630 [Vibrio lamellibrachiae]|uniref:hypothetical protein n=1 Tax=Vibrio lamellibrachiae TaxID=2910253 RepID=UPI003D112E26
MPIANCFYAPSLDLQISQSSSIIDQWANYSEQDASLMTVNFIQTERQHGNAYFVIAELSLPSQWPQTSISKVQLGLAKALTETLSIETHQVLVMTTLIESGLIVENGQEINW